MVGDITYIDTIFVFVQDNLSRSRSEDFVDIELENLDLELDEVNVWVMPRKRPVCVTPRNKREFVKNQSKAIARSNQKNATPVPVSNTNRYA